VHLLPYIEQQALYDSFDFEEKNIDGTYFPGTNERMGRPERLVEAAPPAKASR
jgi:hypothetical protein